MSNEKTTTKSSEIGFLGLLTVLFVGLKLTGYIDWSWWWVVSPLWIPLALLISIIIIGALLVGLTKIVGATVEKLSKKR